LTTHRPPVFVAAVAATVLGALYFVPNASASAEHVSARAAGTVTQQATASAPKRTELAETGGADTTPYLIGGTVFLGVGAALLVNATRRPREMS
jgi:LPXTG-motif cell wall-anchored protein